MFNREQTIEMSVRSVLAQTYSNLELIVVDDCSTDKSVQVVKAIDDSRIQVVVCEKNGGACTARNIGIDYAKGAIIAFQDSDDFWHEDKLEKSLYYLEKKNADFIFSSAYIKGKKKEAFIDPDYNLNKVENKLSKLLGANCVSTQTIVAKKKVFQTIRFDTGLPRFQDWDLALQVVKKNFQIYFIPEPLVDRFYTEDSITSNWEKGKRALEILENKYKADLNCNREGAYEFYFRTAVFFEKSGSNGRYYFKQAFRAKKSVGMLIRYILAQLRIYGLLNSIFSNYFKKS